MNNRQKGILYPLLATLAIGLGYIPSRKALEIAGVIEVNFAWYALQSLFFVAIFYFSKNKIQLSGRKYI